MNTLAALTDPGEAPSPLGQLLNEENTTRYLQSVGLAHGVVADAVRSADRPSTGARPEEVAALVDAVDLDRPVDLRTSLAELERIYLKDAVWFHHPGYAMHLNCPVALPALAAEAVIAGVNTSMDTWDQSGGATMIERRLIRWTAGLIGWESGADGVFTSGGTQSNLQAMLLARGRALAAQARLDPDAAALPMPERLLGLRIYTSADSHFSIANAADLLGLGRAAVVAIPTGEDRRLDPAALEARLRADRRRGLRPMAVVATAGTTDFGAIDPLPRMARAAREHGAWFHVDAAYGGGLLASSRLAPLLEGIEGADSVTLDFHKTWFQPVACSAIVVRRAADLDLIRHHSDYLNPASVSDAESPNQVHKSLQTTRRFDALKLWTTLRVLGREGIGELVEGVVDLAREAERVLTERGDMALRAPVQLSTLVFQYRPEGIDADEAGRLVAETRRRVLARGEANVASTTVDGVPHLKLTLLNPAMTQGGVSRILDLVADAGRAALSARRADVRDAGAHNPADHLITTEA